MAAGDLSQLPGVARGTLSRPSRAAQDPPTENRAAPRARLATAPLPHLPRPTRRRLLYAPRPQRSTPHSARLRPSAGELTCSEAWEEPHRGANIATLPFTGKRRTDASFGPIRLERLENDQLIEIETWSEQRSGDQLIEALKAPVVARFASFLSQPPIRATLTRTLPDRRITITGKRGNKPFEELIS